MSKSLRFFDFHGITPLLDQTLLNAMSAMVAEDVNLINGDLKPWKWATSPITTRVNTIKTAIDTEESCDFITWDTVVDVDLGQPVCSDIGMMFWIDNGVVKQATRSQACNGESYNLGVDCPLQAPSGGVGGGGEGCTTVTSFCYTLVNQYGQEGPPSPPSSVSTSGTGSGSVSIPAGPANHTVNVYRAVADGSTGRENSLKPDGTWVRVGEGLPGTSVSVRALSNVADTLRSTRWASPPTGITSLQVCPGSNALMIAKENVIHVSHPGQYHAFPRDRDIVLQDNVVAMIDYSEAIVVLTDGHPYVIVPRALRERAFIYDVSRMDTSIPCVSKESVSVGAAGVVWASDNGLFILSNGRYGIRTNSLTSQLFDIEHWRDIIPSSIRGEVHNGAYYFTGDGDATCSITGHEAKTWVLNYNDEIYEYPSNVQLTSLSIRPDMWYQTRRDKLYYSLGVNLFEWNPEDGELRDYTYITRDTILQGLTTLKAAKIHHDSKHVVNFSLFKEHCGQSLQIFGRKLTHCRPFRLPGCLATIHQFVKIVSKDRVRSIHLATSIRDLTIHQDSTYNHGNTRRTQRGR